MSLITSISGIRGTIGGSPGDALTPQDIVRFSAAYAEWIKSCSGRQRPRVVLGRDARISGPMVEKLVTGTLMGCGVDVLRLGLASTPTVEMAVPELRADGGIILTASHNPREWNALKLLNSRGEFLSAADGEQILESVRGDAFNYVPVNDLGTVTDHSELDDFHIKKVTELDLVDAKAIRKAGFRVVIDAVNSVGGLILPKLLRQLGVEEVIELFCEPTGEFSHHPEPLPENLEYISRVMVKQKADVGFVVDPDVDRLAIVCEDGSMFGEEYTLVAVADYVLQHTPGPTCSNLSSSRALMDITEQHGNAYYAAAVGEVNVVEKMKEKGCVIGGEGNGGIIYPELHYGRDALVGIALFLSHLAKSKTSCSDLKKGYPEYEIVKNKVSLSAGLDVKDVFERVKAHFQKENITTTDGLKIDFDDGWVHLRESNTEPILRVYAEAKHASYAQELADAVIALIEPKY
jgi:phosphomannomutase